MSKNLARSGIIVSCMTLVSRLLGLARDVVVAHLMGAGAAADVFFFANKIPNFMRRLFAEGAFSQAFIPVLTEYHLAGDKNRTRELIARVSGTLGMIVTVVTFFGVIGSPVVTALFGTGWFIDWVNSDPGAEKFELASFLLKITFPYLWFITFVALSGAILNTIGKFALAAFTPALLNVSIISCAIFIAPNLAQPEIGLALGVFFGGLVQFGFQIPFLYRNGLLVKPKWGWNDVGVKKIRKLMLPALFGVSVSQINLLFDTFIASFLATGSISWLYYSDRLLEFPLGLFGIAIATVILPALSKAHVGASKEHFSNTLDWGVRMVLFLGIPAMTGLIILAKPMLLVLFMRGEFGICDVNFASNSLLAYATGLLSFMLIKILAPGYYARQDTKTPVKYGIIAMLVNIIFNGIFAYFYGYIGLAVATSLSALVNVTLLYRGLVKSNVYKVSKMTLQFIFKLVIAAILMAVGLLYFLPEQALWINWSLITRIEILFALIFAGALVYLLSLFILGIRLKDFK